MNRTLPNVEIVDLVYELTAKTLTLIEKLKKKQDIIDSQEDLIDFWKATAYEHGYNEGEEDQDGRDFV